MLAVGHYPGKISSIWDDVPGEGHGDVFVAHQPIPIIPEVILGVHAAIVQHSIFSPENNLVPQHNLVKFVVGRLVLCGEIEEQLLHIPVEQRVEVSLEVKGKEAQIILLLASSVVWHVLHHHLHRVYVRVHLVLIKEGGKEAEECEGGEDGHCVRCQRVRASQCCMHFQI